MTYKQYNKKYARTVPQFAVYPGSNQWVGRFNKAAMDKIGAQEFVSVWLNGKTVGFTFGDAEGANYKMKTTGSRGPTNNVISISDLFKKAGLEHRNYILYFNKKDVDCYIKLEE